MRKILLVGLCLVNFFGAYAQNKTLGVGVATPNPNAALHVESPGGNQGFIMPRLTTVQRLAMNSLLTGTDKGLMLYDTDMNAVFIWDGLAWGTTSEVENLDPNSTTDAFTVLNTGKGSAARLTTNNSTSKMPVLWAETNSDSALSAPIYGLNTGTGDVAASFRIANTASNKPALFVESNGTGRVATFLRTGTGGGPTVFANVKNTGHGFWSEHEGTNGYAAILQSVNASNPSPAVFVEALGSGFSLFVQKSQATSTGVALYSEHLGASGEAGRFVVNNASHNISALHATTNGTGNAISAQTATGWTALHAVRDGATNGNAAVIQINDAANTYPALQVNNVGSGPALNSVTTGTGFAGNFVVENIESMASSVYAETKGGGTSISATTMSGWSALHAKREGTGNGHAGFFEILNADNQNAALQVNNAGTGSAGSFNNSNPNSGAATLFASSTGMGSAINARHTGASGDALYAEYAGTGDGSAGNFRISNLTNKASAVYAATNGAGPAIGSSHDSKGIAFAIWSGGIQVTTEDITASSIANRASAYRITGTNTTFTLDFGPVNGEVFLIINDTLNPITISGGGSNITLLSGEGKTFIMFPGALKAF